MKGQLDRHLQLLPACLLPAIQSAPLDQLTNLLGCQALSLAQSRALCLGGGLIDRRPPDRSSFKIIGGKTKPSLLLVYSTLSWLATIWTVKRWSLYFLFVHQHLWLENLQT